MSYAPELACPYCGWHVVWFRWAKDGVLGSCYDCGSCVQYLYETEVITWLWSREQPGKQISDTL